ncbi:MAG: molybdenum cofactor biosynthesis F family protein [Clostridiales bacterium]|jgi:hypothetical protein|nr:molybdenum cofactor biosynthesis F family protein [Clostridiales bacterium]
MFFTKFKPMSDEEITKKISAQPRPILGGCELLAGKEMKLHLDGAYAPKQLEYKFLDSDNLVALQNGISYEAEYSAVCLDERIVLLSHIIPGTNRGWHHIIDLKNKNAAVFETWFGIEVPVGIDITGTKAPTHTRKIPREIQRHYYFGWVETDENKLRPEKLHTTTNRLEGRGLRWEYDNGRDILTFFPSVVCSTLVELSDPLGGITMTNPSDYIKIDDEYYIYARWEVEFSGMMWIELLNIAELTSSGLAFGFDDADNLVYGFHRARLTITGDAAHLESITNNGDKAPPMAAYSPMVDITEKGFRYTYRPTDIDVPMPKEEALRHAAESRKIFDGQSIMSGANNLEVSDYLTGKQFTVRLDGEKHTAAPWAGEKQPVYEYDIISIDRLKWRINGGEWQDEVYTAFQPAKDLILFSHMCTGDPDYANLTHAVDFSKGLATTIRAQVGNWHSGWEIGAYAKFGVLEYGDIVPPFARRHHFTTDLVGKCYAWSYSDTMNSIHIYSSPQSYSWTIFQPDNSGGATWSSPCFFIKLREDAYLFQWVEENCNGYQTIVIFNPRTMHDGGFSFVVNHTGLILSLTGAFARKLGEFDIMKYFVNN